jgi:hypothetical protein
MRNIFQEVKAIIYNTAFFGLEAAKRANKTESQYSLQIAHESAVKITKKTRKRLKPPSSHGPHMQAT